MRGRRSLLLAGMFVATTAAAGCGVQTSSREFALVARHAAAPRSARPAPVREPASQLDVPLLSWSKVMSGALVPVGAAESAPAGSSQLGADHLTTRPGEMGVSTRPSELGATSRPNVFGPTTRPGEAIPSGGVKALVPATPKRHYQPWQIRRGPAYKGDWLTSFGRDGKEILPTLWDDTKATATNPWSVGGILTAGVVGIVVNGTHVDNTVEEHYTKHGSQLNRFWDTVGDAGGNPGTHFAVAGAMYFGGLWTDNIKTYETSKALLNALIINDLFTVALKASARTRAPNGNPDCWPSGHTSSSFCLATVLGESYGPWVGVPLFLGASYVGYERIDARNHDFSDVLSGALIGIAIGHAVAQNHKTRILGFEVVPWTDPSQNAVGLAMGKRF